MDRDDVGLGAGKWTGRPLVCSSLGSRCAKYVANLSSNSQYHTRKNIILYMIVNLCTTDCTVLSIKVSGTTDSEEYVVLRQWSGVRFSAFQWNLRVIVVVAKYICRPQPLHPVADRYNSVS